MADEKTPDSEQPAPEVEGQSQQMGAESSQDEVELSTRVRQLFQRWVVSIPPPAGGRSVVGSPPPAGGMMMVPSGPIVPIPWPGSATLIFPEPFNPRNRFFNGHTCRVRSLLR